MTSLPYARRVAFVDEAVLPEAGPPIHIAMSTLIDGQPLAIALDSLDGVFNGVTVTALRGEATVLTFHGVYAPAVKIEVTGILDDGRECLRLWWAGHEWMTPRDAEQIEKIRAAQALPEACDEQFVDFSVFAVEVAFRAKVPA